jgi:hypothetical protein
MGFKMVKILSVRFALIHQLMLQSQSVSIYFAKNVFAITCNTKKPNKPAQIVGVVFLCLTCSQPLQNLPILKTLKNCQEQPLPKSQLS